MDPKRVKQDVLLRGITDPECGEAVGTSTTLQRALWGCRYLSRSEAGTPVVPITGSEGMMRPQTVFAYGASTVTSPSST